MDITALKKRINSNPAFKKFIHWLIIPTNEHQPRWWVKNFLNPYIHTYEGNIKRKVRRDLFPFQKCTIGKGARIEDYTTLNNGVGTLQIGEGSRIGIGNVLIGPITIGKNCLTAQYIVISGLNHNYQDISKPILEQGVSTNLVTLKDGCWIGANSTIVAGVTIGKNAVVGAGSVVTKDVPDYAIAVGNPARVVKYLTKEKREKLDFETITRKSA